jgi:hypothetical protein
MGKTLQANPNDILGAKRSRSCRQQNRQGSNHVLAELLLVRIAALLQKVVVPFCQNQFKNEMGKNPLLVPAISLCWAYYIATQTLCVV